jgi:hypothetical protein
VSSLLFHRSVEWVAYYNSKEKDRLLNVISLEFSHSPLEKYVQAPTVVWSFISLLFFDDVHRCGKLI